MPSLVHTPPEDSSSSLDGHAHRELGRASRLGCKFSLYTGKVTDTIATQEGGQPGAHEARPPDPAPEGHTMPSGLTIISYNTDGCAGKRLSDILSFAAEEKADVVLLQDIASQRWSPAHLQKQGWVYCTSTRIWASCSA